MSLFNDYPTKRMMMNDAVDTLFDKTPKSIVGKPINRVDGPLKVSGQATYSAEFANEISKEKGKLAYGVLVTSTISKGEVESIDTSALDDMDDIIKVVTDPEQFLLHSQQGGKTKAPTQGVKEVAYHGQPIAAVIAETFEAATAGAKMIKVSYKNKVDGANLVFEENLDNAHEVDEKSGSDKNSEQGDPETTLKEADISLDKTYTTPSQSNSPMEPHATIAYWEDDRLVLHTSNQMLTPSKKQVADALNLKEDNVQLICRFVGGGFGSKLGIAPESIAASLSSKELNRPVMIVMTRPQVMEATVRRSNTQQRIGLGCDKDGKIHTIIHESISSNLSDAKFFEPSALSSHYLYQGKNRRVHYKMVDMNWVLSGSMRAPGEAVGQIALECAIDELADQLNMDPIEFRKLNEPEQDPEKDIPFSSRRLIDCMDAGAKAFGWQQSHNPKPASKIEADWWIGTGMAAAARGNRLAPSVARATLQLDDSKTYGVKAVVELDMTDLGTGSYTVFSQIAADLLGLPIDHIEIILGDTDLPSASGSGGSVGASSAGSGVYLACAELRDMLAKQVGLYSDTLQIEAAQVSKVGEHDPSLVERAIKQAEEMEQQLANRVIDRVNNIGLGSDEDDTNTVSELKNQLTDQLTDRVSTAVDSLNNAIPANLKEKLPLKDKLPDDVKETVSNAIDAVTGAAKGSAEKVTAKISQLTQSNEIKIPFLVEPNPDYDFSNLNGYTLRDILQKVEDNRLVAGGKILPGKNALSRRQASYGANFVEVAVHKYTGEIRLKRMTGVFEAGRILNFKTATSQCYGGMVFGIGSALMEEIIHDKHDGRMCNHDLAEYHLPVNADVPQLDVILLEADDKYTNPMHTKGIGETAISGAAAAIANAVYNAVGIRIYDFPITLDKLLDNLPPIPEFDKMNVNNNSDMPAMQAS